MLVPLTAGALMAGVPKIAMELGWAKLVCGEGSARERLAQKRLLLPTPPRQLNSWSTLSFQREELPQGSAGSDQTPSVSRSSM